MAKFRSCPSRCSSQLPSQVGCSCDASWKGRSSPSRYRGHRFRPHRQQFSHQLTPLPNLGPLRKALSATAHTAGEHVDTLGSSGAFINSEVKPDFSEDETSQMDFSTKATPRGQRGLYYLMKTEKMEEKIRQTERMTGHYHHIGPAQSHLRCSESAQSATPTHSAYGITTGLLAQRFVVSRRWQRKT